ncbi:hypothetical protein AMAG_13971 [Allomyces macrogynus ATCC 38327]|uniref:PPM-type phosphatase domain-containing protein n=1 Tax=Allomyces macrogynus (strain ATCC 38327) TaxID=578462 RepID=A0A0L0T366_ALLM3|nr:hypothetical protein AMAG_13971 [Allomyces macrogynus ATCC 38327]|eukprot:KNE69110.1 hypothetical protein AMAG_13971 [Allomyces macrogynus ATCC 38327]
MFRRLATSSARLPPFATVSALRPFISFSAGMVRTAAPRRGYSVGVAGAAAVSRLGKVVLAGALASGAAWAYNVYEGHETTAVTTVGKPLEEMTPAERYVHDRLTANQAVYQGVGTVNECHAAFVASNDPLEDRHSMATVGEKMIINVFDGHAGWQCSDLLSKIFHNYIARHLVTESSDAQLALSKAFDEYDADLMALPDKVKQMASQIPLETAHAILMPAMAGAVLVSAVVDGDKVHVAHSGDCRAVVGRLNNGHWQAFELTHDHDAENPSEVQRMKSEHPGEENSVIMRGRVLGGLQPFRSMGDARYKWPHATQQWIGRVFASSPYPYKAMPRNYKTPPYVTAHPETTTFPITDSDYFMVLATDGLWERVSSAQVVDMVGEYVQQQEKGTWAHQDVNAATHVIRNAFGARDVDTVASLLKIPSPLSRRYRDDITVLVVFFKHRKVGPQFQGKADVESADMGSSKIVVTPEGIRAGPGGPAAKL